MEDPAGEAQTPEQRKAAGEASKKDDHSGCLQLVIGVPIAVILFAVAGNATDVWERDSERGAPAREATRVATADAKPGSDLVMICDIAKTDDATVPVPDSDRRAIGLRRHGTRQLKYRDVTHRTTLIKWVDIDDWSHSGPAYFDGGGRKIHLPPKYMEAMATSMRRVGDDFVRRGYGGLGETECPPNWENAVTDEDPEELRCLLDHGWSAFVPVDRPICAVGVLEARGSDLTFSQDRFTLYLRSAEDLQTQILDRARTWGTISLLTWPPFFGTVIYLVVGWRRRRAARKRAKEAEAQAKAKERAGG